jgi:hypothetical protein
MTYRRGGPASRRRHGPLSGGEHETVSVRYLDGGPARLRAGALFDEQEFTAGVVAAWIAQVDHHL